MCIEPIGNAYFYEGQRRTVQIDCCQRALEISFGVSTHVARGCYGLVKDYALVGEAYYLQAHVFNKLGRIEERTDAATAFPRNMVILNQNQASEMAVVPI